VVAPDVALTRRTDRVVKALQFAFHRAAGPCSGQYAPKCGEECDRFGEKVGPMLEATLVWYGVLPASDPADASGAAGAGPAAGVVAPDVALTAASEGLLAELRENPLPGARYAWVVVKRVIRDIEAEVRKDERERQAAVLNRIKGECRGWFGGSVDNRLLTVELLVDAAIAAMEADR
jgi:hypothetical protein